MFEPNDDAEREIVAVERFRVDLQYRIQVLMNRRKVTQKQLAAKLGVSEARISQIFSSKCNVTIRFIARVFHALEDECWIDSHELQAWKQEKEARKRSKVKAKSADTKQRDAFVAVSFEEPSEWKWSTSNAGHREPCELVAA